MRGLLTKMPGVKDAKVEMQKTDISVTYDPTVTSVDAVIAGLEAAGEPATAK